MLHRKKKDGYSVKQERLHTRLDYLIIYESTQTSTRTYMPQI